MKSWRANSIEPSEAAHKEQPHLDLHCLQIQLFVNKHLSIFGFQASQAHVLSIALIVNEKFRERVPMWSVSLSPITEEPQFSTGLWAFDKILRQYLFYKKRMLWFLSLSWHDFYNLTGYNIYFVQK